MPLHILDEGNNTTLSIDSDVVEAGSGTVRIRGDGNKLEIARGCRLADAHIDLGGGSRLTVQEDCWLAHLEVYATRAASVSIGARCLFTWHTRLLLHEPAAISIGDDCLFASNTLLTVSDMHSIIDVTSQRRINPASDIIVRDHVWIGLNVAVLKGADIGKDSVIGMNATVTRKIPSGCLAVGTPARVIRRGITWSRDIL
jgi:acetyltransferase-like isoleucine patch superfamily enzyme